MSKLEENLTRLEELTAKMESGDLTLDESLSVFEKGINYLNRVRNQLLEAEQRVQVLLDNGKLEPFTPPPRRGEDE